MTDSEFCAECEKRLEKIGRPEWDKNTSILAMSFAGLWVVLYRNTAADDWSAVGRHISTYEAACLNERHLREWLEGQGVFNLTRGNWDYHTALLAAVDALEEKR